METLNSQLSIHLMGNRPSLTERIRPLLCSSTDEEMCQPIELEWVSGATYDYGEFDDECQSVLLIDLSSENKGMQKYFDTIRRMVDKVPVIILTPSGDEELSLHILSLGVQDVISESQLMNGTFRRSIMFAVTRFRRNLYHGSTSCWRNGVIKEEPIRHEQPEDTETERLERRFIEEALRESGRRFRDIAFSIRGWIWEFDKSGRLNYCSDKVKDYLGYSVEEVVGKKIVDFVGSEELKRIDQILNDCVEKEVPIYDLEYWSVHQSGKPVCVLMDGVPVFDVKGGLQGYRGVSRDITSQKENEMERERLIAELEDALSRIKTLRGLLPICASCKKIRDDKGTWNHLETYLQSHSKAAFSHSYCPECADRLLSDIPDSPKGTNNLQTIPTQQNFA